MHAVQGNPGKETGKPSKGLLLWLVENEAKAMLPHKLGLWNIFLEGDRLIGSGLWNFAGYPRQP